MIDRGSNTAVLPSLNHLAVVKIHCRRAPPFDRLQHRQTQATIACSDGQHLGGDRATDGARSDDENTRFLAWHLGPDADRNVQRSKSVANGSANDARCAGDRWATGSARGSLGGTSLHVGGHIWQRQSMHELVGKTTLITGASSGIGAAIALDVARHGSHVVLVARRTEKLEQVAEQARALGVSADCIALDLASPHAAERLETELCQRNVSVDVLVNNAGWGQASRFANLPWEQHQAFLQVMLSGGVELTHRLLPGMLKKRWGRVLLVSSLAALLPGTPGDALYAPTKAFLIKFAQGLNAEMGASGVKITALCPGYTYSEFHDISGTRPKVSKLPAFMWSDASAVASAGVTAMLDGHPVVFPGAFNRFARGLLSTLPDKAVQALWSSRPSRR